MENFDIIANKSGEAVETPSGYLFDIIATKSREAVETPSGYLFDIIAVKGSEITPPIPFIYGGGFISYKYSTPTVTVPCNYLNSAYIGCHMNIWEEIYVSRWYFDIDTRDILVKPSSFKLSFSVSSISIYGCMNNTGIAIYSGSWEDPLTADDWNSAIGDLTGDPVYGPFPYPNSIIEFTLDPDYIVLGGRSRFVMKAIVEGYPDNYLDYRYHASVMTSPIVNIE